MKNQIEIPIVFALFLILICSSCAAIEKSLAKKNITVENGAVPPDIGKDSTILLVVVQGKNQMKKLLMKHTTNEYNGEYKFIEAGEQYMDQYSDTSKYRYVFDHYIKIISGYVDPTDFKTQGRKIKSKRFFIEDKASYMRHECYFGSSIYGKVIQAYMIRLEERRLVNTGTK